MSNSVFALVCLEVFVYFKNNCIQINEGGCVLLAEKYSAWTPVSDSDDIRFMWISLGVLQIFMKISTRPTHTRVHMSF